MDGRMMSQGIDSFGGSTDRSHSGGPRAPGDREPHACVGGPVDSVPRTFASCFPNFIVLLAVPHRAMNLGRPGSLGPPRLRGRRDALGGGRQGGCLCCGCVAWWVISPGGAVARARGPAGRHPSVGASRCRASNQGPPDGRGPTPHARPRPAPPPRSRQGTRKGVWIDGPGSVGGEAGGGPVIHPAERLARVRAGGAFAPADNSPIPDSINDQRTSASRKFCPGRQLARSRRIGIRAWAVDGGLCGGLGVHVGRRVGGREGRWGMCGVGDRFAPPRPFGS